MTASGTDGSAAAFLEAAEAMVIEARDLSLVQRLTVAEIVRGAGRGLTRGAFTHHWPTRRAFELDLLLVIAQGVRDRSANRLDDALASVLDAATEVRPVEELFEAGVEASVGSFANSPDLPLLLGLWSSGMQNPAVLAPMRESWRIADEGLEERLGLLLAVFRLRIRFDSSLRDLAMSLISMINGYALRMAVLGPEDGLTVDLRLRNAMAVVEAHTEPIDQSAG